MKEYKECKDCPTTAICRDYKECLNRDLRLKGSVVWIKPKGNYKPFAATICNRQRVGSVGEKSYRYKRLDSGVVGSADAENIHRLNNHDDHLKLRKAVLAYELRKAKKLIEDNTKD